jgi:hypothetical protein
MGRVRCVTVDGIWAGVLCRGEDVDEVQGQGVPGM